VASAVFELIATVRLGNMSPVAPSAAFSEINYRQITPPACSDLISNKTAL
jgi:hypothetical protein